MLKIYNELIKKIDSNRVCQNEPMSKHTTFKIGGPADIFIKIDTLEELEIVLELAKKEDVPVTIIGNGSNLIVKDMGIRGIVIKLDFNKINVEDNLIFAEAGVLLSKLARIAYDNSLKGLEAIAGIPGSFGGAIYMNAGANGEEISGCLMEITYIDENLNIKTIKKEDAMFGYRSSIFQDKEWIILNGKIELEHGIQSEIKEKMQQYLEKRITNQPLNLPNAGSVFKRGENYITAKLIDECGLKGYSIGDAVVSEKHAGFIVNKGKAKASDVIALIEHIKSEVKNKYNICLETEVKIIGEN